MRKTEVRFRKIAGFFTGRRRGTEVGAVCPGRNGGRRTTAEACFSICTNRKAETAVNERIIEKG